jgi:hypothetical protein
VSAGHGRAPGPGGPAAPRKRWGRRILVGAVGVVLILALFAACSGGGRAQCREQYRADYYAKHAANPTQSQVDSACGRSGGGFGWIFLGGGSRSSGTDYRGGSYGSGK